MAHNTYTGYNVAKTSVSFVAAGSDDFISGAHAYLKVDGLRQILQDFYQDPGAKFTGKKVDANDVKQAIAYVVRKNPRKRNKKP